MIVKYITASFFLAYFAILKVSFGPIVFINERVLQRHELSIFLLFAG